MHIANANVTWSLGFSFYVFGACTLVCFAINWFLAFSCMHLGESPQHSCLNLWRFRYKNELERTVFCLLCMDECLHCTTPETNLTGFCPMLSRNYEAIFLFLIRQIWSDCNKKLSSRLKVVSTHLFLTRWTRIFSHLSFKSDGAKFYHVLICGKVQVFWKAHKNLKKSQFLTFWQKSKWQKK